jgi:hypothetical protein
MTLRPSFDERARTLTKSLLVDAERIPARINLERPKSARWKSVAAFVVTALLITGAFVGASIALHGGSAVTPRPANPGGFSWTSIPLQGAITGSPTAISCPDAANCVAFDNAGQVIVSTNPGGGKGGRSDWAITVVEQGVNVNGVSCPDPSLCVAVDQHGSVLTSTNPWGGAAWTISRVDGQANLSGISCPTESLCVAVGGSALIENTSGVLMTSTDPRAGPGTWNVMDPGGVQRLLAVSCPSVSFCVAADQSGDVLTSTDPAGGAGAWKVTNVVTAPNSLSAISCPTVSLCVGVDAYGNVITSTDPAGGSDAWTMTTIDSSLLFQSVSCASANLCVAGALGNSVYVSTNPRAGAQSWTAERVSHVLVGMFAWSCPTAEFCVGIDGAGTVDIGSVHAGANPSP